MNESKRMNESKPTCCWLPATATKELSKPGMSEGDKRMWTDQNGCKELATWRVYSDDSAYPHVSTKSCAKHLSDLCVESNTVYHIKANRGYTVQSIKFIESSRNGGSGTGVYIVDPSTLKAVGGTGSGSNNYRAEPPASEPSAPVCFCGGDCRASRYRKLSSP